MIAPQQASRRGTTHPLVDGVSAPTSPHLRIGDHAWLVSGLDEVDSSALLAELEQAVTAPEHVLALDWQVGDLAVFDNRVMLHRRAGTPPADPGRVLRRVLVVAEG